VTRARILADYVAGGTTAAEFDHMDGVTSNVQTQLDAKLPLAGGTMTGNIVMGDDTSIGIADDAERIEFDGAGDISVLGANLGVGIAAPAGDLHLSESGASEVRLQMTNSNTGHASSDGFAIVQAANGTDMYLYNYESGTLNFGTANSTRMLITDSGNVGIGGTPSYKLDVSGSFRATDPIYLTNEGTEGGGVAADSAIKWHDLLFMHAGGATYQLEEVTSGDQVMLWNRNGNVHVGGSFTSSDELYKKDIVDISYGLAEVLAMKPREYTVKRSGLDSIGFIAQEIETIIPEIVQGENAEIKEENKKIEYDDGTTETRTTYTVGKSLDYNAFSAILCKAVQELSAKVTALENA
tara:strand:- start:375 stop:1433 length:1059 start_codon:yes stop_codon:yes gene_type:complete